MREKFYILMMCLTVTSVFAQDDIVLDGVTIESQGRNVAPREEGSSLNDQEINDLAAAARTNRDKLEKADLGVVPSDAAQVGMGGSLGTVMANKVNPVIAPTGKPFVGDLSRKKVQE